MNINKSETKSASDGVVGVGVNWIPPVDFGVFGDPSEEGAAWLQFLHHRTKRLKTKQHLVFLFGSRKSEISSCQ